MDNLEYLVIAYMLIWLILGYYLYTLTKRLKDLKTRLLKLKDKLNTH
ncbi:MAG: CcmD family protein [Deferribacterota bacterium]|nr:CcmD family protein [Deferribacterota bacterium]